MIMYNIRTKMADETPTNNFVPPELLPVNVSCSGPLSLLQSSCSTSTSLNRISSLDLSVNIPHHPELRVLGYSLEANALSGKYSLLMPDAQVSTENFVGLSISIAIGLVIAAASYHFLLHARGRRPVRTFLIGSLICVAISILPYALFDALGTQNTAVRLSLMSPFILYGFRVIEAVFGFVPRGAEASFRLYCIYFAAPAELLFDNKTYKPIKVTTKDVIRCTFAVVKYVTCISILCSVLSPRGYLPFGATEAGEFYEQILVGDYLNTKHLANCFAIAFFFQSALALGFCVLGNSVQLLTGYKVLQAMNNPMLEATSPSDFWGRRWNVLIHLALKRGVYKPVRKYASALIASLAVFVASGLFHEWLVHAIFVYKRDSEGAILGSNSAFFVWNFVVILCERMLSGTEGVKSLRKVLPRFMVTFIIIMSSLPFAHWFGGPYLKGNFFSDYETFVPLVRKL